MPSLPYRQLNFIQFKSPVYFTEGSFNLVFFKRFKLLSQNMCFYVGVWIMSCETDPEYVIKDDRLHRVCVLCLVTSCHLFFHFLSFLSEQEPVFLLLYDRK